MDIVAHNIRRIREFRGLLQKELAGRADIDPSNLSKLERGEYTWTKENLGKLADALEVPVSAFFLETPIPLQRTAESGVERTLGRRSEEWLSGFGDRFFGLGE